MVNVAANDITCAKCVRGTMHNVEHYGGMSFDSSAPCDCVARPRAKDSERDTLTAWFDGLDPIARRDLFSNFGLDGLPAEQISLEGLRVARTFYEFDG